MALSAANVRTEVRTMLNESSAGFHSDTEIDNWVSQAAIDISSKTGCVETTATQVLTVSTIAYDAPTSFTDPVPTSSSNIKIHYAFLGLISLVKIRPNSLGRITPDATGDTPSQFLHWGERVFFYPVGSGASGTVTMLCSVESDDITDIPDEWQLAAILYGTMRGKYKDNKYAQGAALYAEYINTLGFQRNDLLERGVDSKQAEKIPDIITAGAA